MEDSTTNIVGSETIQRRRDDEIWKAEDTIEIPSGSACNVVSYAFANLDQYDRDRPVSTRCHLSGDRYADATFADLR